jgi:uncharacterized protein (TIGR03435 family)
MRRSLCCFAIAALLIIRLHSQPAEAGSEFDVASVRASPPQDLNASMQMSAGALTIANAPMIAILGAAFGISPERQSYLIAGPDWVTTERYDIRAKFSPEAVPPKIRLMLQALLRTRFGMGFHRETKYLPAYALVVGKSGFKGHPAAKDGRPGFRKSVGHLESESATMALLADKLSQQSDRPIVDATGLTGAYAISLLWTPDELDNAGRTGASLYTAIEEQLGLKLEARKEAMEVIVIDHLERTPTGN